MLAGHELARVIEEFEINCMNRCSGNTDTSNLKHHEDTKYVQVTFARDVRALVIEEMGNPFTEDSVDLLVLDTRDVADPTIVETVRVIEKTGRVQYERYMAERVAQRTTPISDPISRNQLPLFSRPPSRVPSTAKQTCITQERLCIVFPTVHCLSNS